MYWFSGTFSSAAMFGIVQCAFATDVLLGATETTIFLQQRWASLKMVMHCRGSLAFVNVPSSFFT
jgi:hypothetical protein